MGRHTISLRLRPQPGGTRSSGFCRRFLAIEGSVAVVAAAAAAAAAANGGRGESDKMMVTAEGLTLVNSTSGLRRMVAAAALLPEFA